ncbi:MAG: cytochrome c peroxidase [Kofleriaceae bacterium]
MRTKALMWTLALATAGAGCGKKDDGKSPASGGPTKPTGSAAPAAPQRPSQLPMATMPARAPAPTEPAKLVEVALGRKLFLDPRLSVDGSRSCYSCHQNEQGTGGKDPKAIGAGDKPLPRHSPMLWNVAAQQGAFYWDGRSPSLEAQAKAAWAGGNMGVGTEEGKLDAKAAEIAKLADYKAAFAAAYPNTPVTADVIVGAIAAFEATLVCDDTAYDKYAAGDKTAMTEEQLRGYDVFAGKGGCMTCHAPPYFSTSFAVPGGAYFNAGLGTEAAEPDVGRMAVTKEESDWGAMKPPSLRNITKTAPYFHDGSAATLDDALKVMTTGGIANKNKSPLLVDRQLTAAELADLKAFLGALECGGAIDTTDVTFGSKAGQVSLETGLVTP